MCKIIVMANQKGGVAKTSSTRNLAYSLAELGKKVLAVDFDPQTNLTISFGVAPAALQETAASLMMKLVMDEALPEKGSYILNIGKVDLLPSKKTLTVAEVNLLIERKDDCLAKLLAPLRADYDYILVDTGPSLGSLTINAFTAADEIIIPVDPELFALVGLKELTETISKIKQNLNPKVEIIGILFTKCSKRTTLYRQTSEQVRSVFGHLPIFESQIPATVQVGTANSKGLSVMELDAKSPAATAYMNLAKEVLAYAYQELKALLTDEEYKAAMRSTITAYYTEPELIRYMYRALERFGFEGGPDRRILDPGMGTGNFYSVLPEQYQGTKLYGVELDSITGRIAKQLYPEADISIMGYEAVKFEDNSFDVILGNIPFNSVKIYDRRY